MPAYQPCSLAPSHALDHVLKAGTIVGNKRTSLFLNEFDIEVRKLRLYLVLLRGDRQGLFFFIFAAFPDVGEIFYR